MIPRSLRCAFAAIALALLAPFGHAHEVRPAYLELRETAPGVFDVLWKTPMRGELRLALDPEFSGRTSLASPPSARATRDAVVRTWTLSADEPLRGQSVAIRGLEATLTDALVRIEFADGATWVERLTPQQPAATIPAATTGLAIAGEYFGLGVEHILLGIDHLLFVLALVVLVRNRWQLVSAITAFTVAHSITLALATLGFVRVPQAPVEAVIALSVAFVAAEIVRSRRGHGGFAARAPWTVAFAFGLLHGFGFAGALAEVGLPAANIPVALLFFNLGVEAGQLLFIGAVLAAAALARRIRFATPRWAGLVPPYAIGSVAMFWVAQRIAAF
jgi:hydrogenase/urease accessory protein HupE